MSWGHVASVVVVIVSGIVAIISLIPFLRDVLGIGAMIAIEVTILTPAEHPLHCFSSGKLFAQKHRSC